LKRGWSRRRSLGAKMLKHEFCINEEEEGKPWIMENSMFQYAAEGLKRCGSNETPLRRTISEGRRGGGNNQRWKEKRIVRSLSEKMKRKKHLMYQHLRKSVLDH